MDELNKNDIPEEEEQQETVIPAEPVADDAETMPTASLFDAIDEQPSHRNQNSDDAGTMPTASLFDAVDEQPSEETQKADDVKTQPLGYDQPQYGNNNRPNGFGTGGYAPNGNYNGNYKYNNYGQNPNGPTMPGGYRPNGYNPNGYNPNGYNPNGYNPNGFTPGGYNPPPVNNGKKKKGNDGLKIFIAIIAVVVIIAVAVMISLFKGSGNTENQKPSSEQVTNSAAAGNSPQNVEDLSASQSALAAGEPAVVAEIAKKYNVGILIYSNDSLYTEGSGVITKEDDTHTYTYILTCAHVINYKNVAVSVLMNDGKEYPAEVVGIDSRTDIGVVRIKKTGFTCAEFADSDELIVGQTVYAVGNPGGSEFFGSVTNGIISAIDRPISSSSTGYQMECIQHTSAINPGNSGGALVNGEGKVIGINSMKIASTEYEGMGFSVPSNVVIKVFNSIIKNGYVAGRPKLGISYVSPSGYSQTYAMYVQMKGLPAGTIVIADIGEDTAFKDMDVKVGDMITKVNGKEMTDTGMLSDMIEKMSVGDTLKLTIVRVNTRDWSQTEKEVTVKLIEDKGSAAQPAESGNKNNSGGNPFGNSDDLYEFFKEYYGF